MGLRQFMDDLGRFAGGLFGSSERPAAQQPLATSEDYAQQIEFEKEWQRGMRGDGC